MSRKTKSSPPKDREAVLLQVRQLLAEHFKFGNSYAAKSLAREAEDILWPIEEEETEDDEEEEEA